MTTSIVRFRPLDPQQGLSVRPLVALILVLPLLLGLVACEGAEEREPEEVGTTAGSEPAAGGYFEGGEAGEPGELGSSAVEVRLNGRSIEMPDSLPAGETTFLVSNDGEDEHGFEVEGNGIEEVLEPNLMPGETGELTVRLEPGSYTVYCPVGDHREEGMVTTLRVVG